MFDYIFPCWFTGPVWRVLFTILPNSIFMRYFHYKINYIKVFLPDGFQIKARCIYNGVFYYTTKYDVIELLNSGMPSNVPLIKDEMYKSCFAYGDGLVGASKPIDQQIKGMYKYDKDRTRKVKIKIVLI